MPQDKHMTISPSDPSLCQTSNGLIRGKINGKSMTWYNVPFGKAKRWCVPEKPDNWNGVRDGRSQGNICPQPKSPIESLFATPAATTMSTAKVIQDEDCLNLNIFTPDYRRLVSSQNGLPVMVWVHGGAFKTGANALPLYDATTVVEENNVIVVVINYRLNVFGFLGSKELLEECGTTGNYGLLDQVLAFEWIRDNIADFGGDPNNVTAFGESAGSISLHYLVCNAKGLFHRLILQSGTAGTIPPAPLSRSQRVFDTLAKHFKLDGLSPKDKLEALRAIPTKDLLQAACGETSSGPNTDNQWEWSPCVDNGFIRGDYRQWDLQGRWDPDVKQVLMGMCDDEGTMFSLNYMTGNVEEPWIRFLTTAWGVGSEIYQTYKSKQVFESASKYMHDNSFAEPIRFTATCMVKRGLNVWMYRFSQPWSLTTKFGLGSHHAAELPFVFLRDAMLTPEEGKLARRMVQDWTSFASVGQPGDEWKKYPVNVMQFGPLDKLAILQKEESLKGSDRWKLLDKFEEKALQRSAKTLKSKL